MRKKKKRNKVVVISVTCGLILLLVVAILVANIFIPLKYFTAYLHFSGDKNAEGRLRITYLDVGYGDCTLVELPDGKSMLIDGGDGSYSHNYKIIDYLNSVNIDKIDYLVCTSVNNEHCGGLKDVVRYKTIGTAYIPYVRDATITQEYSAFYSELLSSGAEVKIAEYGEGEASDDSGYWFCFLSPSMRLAGQSEYDDMNARPTGDNIDAASAVLWLDCFETGYAFLSDVSANVQQKMTMRLMLEGGGLYFKGKIRKLSACAMLTVPNHGANGYFDTTFYDLLYPSAALLFVGQNANSRPAPASLTEIELFVGDELYRTDINGNITVICDNDNFSISKEQQ